MTLGSMNGTGACETRETREIIKAVTYTSVIEPGIKKINERKKERRMRIRDCGKARNGKDER